MNATHNYPKTKISLWVIAYGMNGINHWIGVQAKSRRAAVTKLRRAGYDITRPKTVRKAICVAGECAPMFQGWREIHPRRFP